MLLFVYCTSKKNLKVNNKFLIEHIINYYQKYQIKHIYILSKNNFEKKNLKNKFFNFKHITFLKINTIKDFFDVFTKYKVDIQDSILTNSENYFVYDFVKIFNKFKKQKKNFIFIQKKYKINFETIENKLLFFKKNYIKKISLLKKKNLHGNDFNYQSVYKVFKHNHKKIINILKKPAIFLDRDGVLNKDIGHFCETKKIKWIESTLNLLSKISKNFRLFIVTNQSGIARGYFTKKQFLIFQNQYQALLNSKNIFIDDIRYCPHHPSIGFKQFKKKCNCRKPKNGMIKNLLGYWDVDLKKSFMIGDQKSDFLAAEKSNLKFFYNNKKNYQLILKKLNISNFLN